jgi:hypothetical protein
MLTCRPACLPALPCRRRSTLLLWRSCGCSTSSSCRTRWTLSPSPRPSTSMKPSRDSSRRASCCQPAVVVMLVAAAGPKLRGTHCHYWWGGRLRCGRATGVGGAGWTGARKDGGGAASGIEGSQVGIAVCAGGWVMCRPPHLVVQILFVVLCPARGQWLVGCRCCGSHAQQHRL